MSVETITEQSVPSSFSLFDKLFNKEFLDAEWELNFKLKLLVWKSDYDCTCSFDTFQSYCGA